MDSFFAQNKNFFIEQVAVFEAKLAEVNATTNSDSISDTLIGARIRPLLQREVDNGRVIAISTKPDEGCAVVHELRAKINGKPAITASISILMGQSLYR